MITTRRFLLVTLASLASGAFATSVSAQIPKPVFRGMVSFPDPGSPQGQQISAGLSTGYDVDQQPNTQIGVYDPGAYAKAGGDPDDDGASSVDSTGGLVGLSTEFLESATPEEIAIALDHEMQHIENATSNPPVDDSDGHIDENGNYQINPTGRCNHGKGYKMDAVKVCEFIGNNPQHKKKLCETYKVIQKEANGRLPYCASVPGGQPESEVGPCSHCSQGPV